MNDKKIRRVLAGEVRAAVTHGEYMMMQCDKATDPV